MRSKKKIRLLDPKRAVAYLRVSTEDQKLGPEAQRIAIAAWASREGVELVSERIDHGVSGAAPIEDRPGLLDAFDDLRRLDAGVLIAAKRDRIARDTMIVGMIERLAERQGAKVRTADGAGEGDSPESEMLRGIVDVFAQYERAVIRARTVSALRAKRARGERVGTLPYGYEIDPESRVLSRKSGLPQGMRPCAREQAIITEARRLQAKGLDCRAIADHLNRSGMKNRGNGWNQPGVWRLLHVQPLGR